MHDKKDCQEGGGEVQGARSMDCAGRAETLGGKEAREVGAANGGLALFASAGICRSGCRRRNFGARTTGCLNELALGIEKKKFRNYVETRLAKPFD